VTHQLQFINDCDKVVIVENGKISASGTYNSVIKSDSVFASTIRDFNNNASNEEKEEDTEDITDFVENGSALNLQSLEKSDADKEVGKALTTEDSAIGNVPLSLYAKFFKNGSSMLVMIIMILALIIGQGASIAGDIWLGHWSSQSPEEQRVTFYPIVWVSISLFTLTISMARSIIFFRICLNSTKSAFNQMLDSVFKSPMSFFQSVPHGRLMNRFSKDINLMDEMLPQVFFNFVQCLFISISCIVVAGAYIPVFLFLVPILCVFFLYLRRFYMKSSRQIKRIESTTRSPVYSSFPSTLEGLSIIRAFSAEDRFLSRFYHIQDENSRIFFSFLSSSRWLGFRLDLLSSCLVSMFTFASVYLSDTIPAGSAGLLLSYLMQLTGLLQWCVRQSAELENLMISAERVYEYSRLPSEAPASTEIIPPENWPANGKLELKNMSLAYPNFEIPDEKSEPILKDLTITFEPGMKIGIVGRTGAGKSSFLQALFRIVEPSPSKSIIIDGIPTSDIGLFDLRSRLSIIPQEPFCFKGTIRFNLDPFNQFADDELWTVLDAVELKGSLMASADKLESEVTENGANWSVGERQLICLARAILRNSRLIVMDEATSSVDVHTDQLIQKAIRTGLFSNSTVLTIAHRLNTVIDYDRILVLDRGQIVEYGVPSEMLKKDIADPTAWFARMVSEMGLEAQVVLTRMANEMI
jgi:ATP-binding cassette subfamily C (CFTR/MRP) protein 4